MRGTRKAGRAAWVGSWNPRLPFFKGRCVMRKGRVGRSAEVFVMCWRRRVVVDWRASVKGDNQD
jgi:hypothetical protein